MHIETHGCAFNTSDSEVMAGLLERAGHVIADSPDTADAVIVNSCTVKDRTYLDFHKRVRELSAAGVGPVLILAGCVPRVPEQAREFAAHPQVGPDNITSIVEVVERALAGERPALTRRSASEPRLLLPKRRRNPAVEIVPISRGCLGSCTFCQTVLARGRLHSFPEDDILAQIRAAEEEGVRMVWLTSQDCGAYGADTGTSLPALRRRVAGLPGDFTVRVGMANPDHVGEWAEEFADALAHPRFFRFAHVPVQSGSDAVLRDMARPYAADGFRRIAEVLRARMPDVTLATDLIVGFPTETEADFADTLRLVRDTRPPVINRSRFSPRPGTRAARLPVLPSAEVSARSRELYALARRVTMRELDGLAGRTLWAVAESNPRPDVTMFRTRAYVPVIVRGHHAPGSVLDIRVRGVDGFHAVGDAAVAACPANSDSERAVWPQRP